MKRISKRESRWAIALTAVSGLLLLGKAAEMFGLNIEAPYLILLFACIGLISGLATGIVSPCPTSLARLFLLWLPGSVLFQILIGYDGVYGWPSLTAWQFIYGFPLLLAALGAVATSVAGRAQRERRYAHLFFIAAIGALLWLIVKTVEALVAS